MPTTSEFTHLGMHALPPSRGLNVASGPLRILKSAVGPSDPRDLSPPSLLPSIHSVAVAAVRNGETASASGRRGRPFHFPPENVDASRCSFIDGEPRLKLTMVR